MDDFLVDGRRVWVDEDGVVIVQPPTGPGHMISPQFVLWLASEVQEKLDNPPEADIDFDPRTRLTARVISDPDGIERAVTQRRRLRY